MTDQEAIAGAVLNTPDPDRFVDCGESRPLPMFHMATLMQYGERCAEAALAWLRSQGEPAAWMSDDGAIEESHKPWMDAEINPAWHPLFLAPQPAIPNRIYNAISLMVTQAMAQAAENGANSRSMPDEYVEIAAWLCGIPDDAEAKQPAIPDGWQPIETMPKDFESFDVWSARRGRISDCTDGMTTYGKKRGIVFQSGYDSDGPVMDLIEDATHWMRVASPEPSK